MVLSDIEFAGIDSITLDVTALAGLPMRALRAKTLSCVSLQHKVPNHIDHNDDHNHNDTAEKLQCSNRKNHHRAFNAVLPFSGVLYLCTALY